MELIEICKRAKEVKYEVQNLCTDKKNKALLAVADKLEAKAQDIINANKKDYENGEKNGMHQGLLDRLLLDEKRIKAMADGLRVVAELPDPVGEVTEEFERPNGLKIKKVRVPMGVIGIIYEARPNVTADAFALTFKAGNAVVLKGGSDRQQYSDCKCYESCTFGMRYQSRCDPAHRGYGQKRNYTVHADERLC